MQEWQVSTIHIWRIPSNTPAEIYLITEDQKAFYTLFWSTQSFLTNPPSIFVEGNYEKFKTVNFSLMSSLYLIFAQIQQNNVIMYMNRA